MSVSKLDAKKRVVIPLGRPGDVYDVQTFSEGQFLLVRLEKPEAGRAKPDVEQVRRALERAPLESRLTWERLREQTREP